MTQGSHIPAGPSAAQSLIPPEPMGLPIAAWIGGAIYLIMLILILGSMV